MDRITYEIENVSEADRKKFTDELDRFFQKIDYKIIELSNLSKIIITDNFDEKVRLYENNPYYSSTKGYGNAIARVIFCNDLSKIILLKLFWFKSLPIEPKYYFLAHELDHCLYNKLTLDLQTDAEKNNYLAILDWLYKEYSATKNAILFFPQPYGSELCILFDSMYPPYYEESFKNLAVIREIFKTSSGKFGDLMNLNQNIFRTFLNNYSNFLAYIDTLDFYRKEFKEKSNDQDFDLTIEILNVLNDYYADRYELSRKLDYNKHIKRFKKTINRLWT